MASQVYFEKGQSAVPITYVVCVHSEQCFLDGSSAWCQLTLGINKGSESGGLRSG